MSYKIFGAELSPYSVKIRSYFRFKGLPHAWTLRNVSNMEEFKQYARLPLVPLVVTPEKESLQDSTPIMDAIEARHPVPSIHPEDKTLRFLSILIEDFGDEWANKWMFHYRWSRQADQLNSGTRIARGSLEGMAEGSLTGMAEGSLLKTAEGSSEDSSEGMAEGSLLKTAEGSLLKTAEGSFAPLLAQVIERMTARIWFVGSNETTAPLIEASFHRMLRLLDAHLAGREYLFGSRPTYGDLGLWAQCYEMWVDPTPGSYISTIYLNVQDWIQRMHFPTDSGRHEPWQSLAPTLAPLLELIGGLYMPWNLANEKALAAGAEEFSCELSMGTWVQKPQKYHAKALAVLRQKYQVLAGDPLDGILADAGILDGLSGGSAEA